MSDVAPVSPGIVPCLRYKDAPAAIAWLCRAFDFEEHLVVPGEGGTVAHAQLTYGRGMIMLGSTGADGTGWEALMATPDERGGTSSQAPYVVVKDVDAHHDRARAAGADIVAPPADKETGGRDYTCCDPEGNVWTFGSYDPWA